MSRIENAFRNKKAFITFVTVGDPDIETTEKLIYAMEEAGADLIQLYSGLIYEGPELIQTCVEAIDGYRLSQHSPATL